MNPAINPVGPNGQAYFSLGKSNDTFLGADLPTVTSTDTGAPHTIPGDYGEWIRLNFSFANTDSVDHLVRVYAGNIAGSVFITGLAIYMAEAVNPGAASAAGLTAGQYVELFNMMVPAGTSVQSPVTAPMAVLTLGAFSYPIMFIITTDSAL